MKLCLLLVVLALTQVVCVDVAKAEKKVGKWQTSWSSPVKKTWSYSYSYSWSWSNSWPIPESPKCKKGLCVPVQPWLKNKDTGAVNGKTLEEVCNDIRDCQTCAESPNCDWDPTYSEGCGPPAAGQKMRKCKPEEGGEPYPSVDEFLQVKA